MYRPWIIQIIGVLLILLLLLFSIPFAKHYISNLIANDVQVDLDKKGLTWVKVQAKGREIHLTGYTTDSKQHQQAVAISRANPWVKRVDDHITPAQLIAPYTLAIQWNGEMLTIKGYVGSDQDKAIIEQQIVSAFAGKKIQQELTLAVGAPQNWTKLTSQLLKQIKTFALASIQMVDDAIYISGKTNTSKEVTALENGIRPFSRESNSQGYVFTTRVVALDKAAIICQETFTKLLKDDSIHFETGTTSIDIRSDDLLKKLADTAIFCANSTIIITGYTDNVGDIVDNLHLSEQRAKVVKGRLFTQGGVPFKRLKAIGKGANSPIASNETKDGRAKNRRIEFTVEDI